jgi:hypothetical protein
MSSPQDVFDLYVYCEPCGGQYIARLLSDWGGSGPYSSMEFSAGDVGLHTDSFNLLIEVRFRDQEYPYCAGWSVELEGDVHFPDGSGRVYDNPCS